MVDSFNSALRNTEAITTSLSVFLYDEKADVVCARCSFTFKSQCVNRWKLSLKIIWKWNCVKSNCSFFFQATVGQERHLACKLIRKDSTKCCFGLTIFCKGDWSYNARKFLAPAALLPINLQCAIFCVKNNQINTQEGSFSLTAQNIMSRAMSLVLTKSIQTKEKEWKSYSCAALFLNIFYLF